MSAKLLVRPAALTGLLLLIPLVMTFLDRHKALGEGWHWKPFDFLVMGVLLLAAGTAYEWLAIRYQATWQKLSVAAMVLLCVLAVWSELAVNALSKAFRLLLG